MRLGCWLYRSTAIGSILSRQKDVSFRHHFIEFRNPLARFVALYGKSATMNPPTNDQRHHERQPLQVAD